ncbi:MAG TPA: hypothetical protein VHA52_05645 [Candidatus Babeliaceae bacterium]|nr:hypothetical protein [Candidatus Babeliaceae bacterium]
MNIQDQKEQAQGKVVKFGLSQLINTTPHLATVINRVVLASITFYGFINVTTHLIPAPVQMQVNQWILLLPGLTTFLKNVFGWDFPSDSNYSDHK